jgi:hypothetical protein
VADVLECWISAMEAGGAFSVFSSDTDSRPRTMPPMIEPLVSRDWILGAPEMIEKSDSADIAEFSELLESRRRERSTRLRVVRGFVGAAEPSDSCQHMS